MTNASDQGVRRYSDILTTGYIKTGADGRKIFYPWGMLGNGYVFPSNAAYERLNDLLKIYTVVALTIILPVAMPGQYLAAAILTALALVFYVVWTSFELRGLQRTDERLRYREGITNLARLIPGWFLWAAEIGALMFVAAGIVMLIAEPGQWMIALSSTIFFGFCAVVYAIMLVLRRRTASGQA